MKQKNPTNVQIVRALNKRLKQVPITAVAKNLNRSHQSLYFYLDENKAATANLEMLAKIAEAISAVEKEQRQRQQKNFNSLTKLIKA